MQSNQQIHHRHQAVSQSKRFVFNGRPKRNHQQHNQGVESPLPDFHRQRLSLF
ncbi:Uncharacterised protein [Vibrio cholerae]|nr:Uncharacterised protein [Vibrio cholerae]